jgi:RluA family pseudouridine synthase
MDLPILYEDADMLAINKPAGLMTHPDGRSTAETAQDMVAREYKNAMYAHRLDRETSGVLIFAKTEAALEFLKKAFKNREVAKTYLAVVYGVPKEKKGVINFEIGRSRKDFRLRSAQPKARGTMRDAITRYEVLSEDSSHTHSLLNVQPETGRTHQIRVHLKAIHHPVVCDRLYAPNHPCDLGTMRLTLHAYQIDLPIPSGGRTTITAPVPSDLTPAFAQFPDFAF